MSAYDGWLHVGLDADADLVPDLEKLEHSLEEAFAALQGSRTAQRPRGLVPHSEAKPSEADLGRTSGSSRA